MVLKCFIGSIHSGREWEREGERGASIVSTRAQEEKEIPGRFKGNAIITLAEKRAF